MCNRIVAAMLRAMETVTRQLELDITADELWSLITDNAALQAWLGDGVDIDVRPGGFGVVVDDDVIRHITVDEVEHGRGWSFHWYADGEPESTVTFAIDPVDDGAASRLTITETLSASASTERGHRWDLCLLLLWACSVASAILR